MLEQLEDVALFLSDRTIDVLLSDDQAGHDPLDGGSVESRVITVANVHVEISHRNEVNRATLRVLEVAGAAQELRQRIGQELSDRVVWIVLNE